MTLRPLTILAALAAAPALAPTGAAAEDYAIDRYSQTQYMLHCSGCHLRDGSGFHSQGIPPFEDVIGRFLQHPAGRDYLVNVGGSRTADIDMQKRMLILNYIIAAWGGEHVPADHTPFTLDEVSALHGAWTGDSAQLRRQIQDDLAAEGNYIVPIRLE